MELGSHYCCCTSIRKVLKPFPNNFKFAVLQDFSNNLKWALRPKLVVWSSSLVPCLGNPIQRFSRNTSMLIIKHGGGRLMVKGCCTSTGPVDAQQPLTRTCTGHSAVIDSTMNFSVHQTPSVWHLRTGCEWIIQQDNDPEHMRMAKKSDRIEVLAWPRESPDLKTSESNDDAYKSKFTPCQWTEAIF